MTCAQKHMEAQEAAQVILASASPRRKELLERFAITFRVVPSTYEEHLQLNMSPQQQVLHLARGKAAEVAERCEGLILAADTIVVCDDEILGKPSDAADALRMLRSLSGRSHEVLTALALHHTPDQRCLECVESTRVYFRSLGEAELMRYIQSGEPMDKAGAYAIQGMGAVFVERVEGCYHNVVGLPLQRLHRMLHEFQISLL